MSQELFPAISEVYWPKFVPLFFLLLFLFLERKLFFCFSWGKSKKRGRKEWGNTGVRACARLPHKILWLVMLLLLRGIPHYFPGQSVSDPYLRQDL